MAPKKTSGTGMSHMIAADVIGSAASAADDAVTRRRKQGTLSSHNFLVFQPLIARHFFATTTASPLFSPSSPLSTTTSMDSSLAPTATNSRAQTPIMPEKEAGAGARFSRAETLTIVSHDADASNTPTEKKSQDATVATGDAERAEEGSTILTGRKLFLVFV
jgi:hypothetical protein